MTRDAKMASEGTFEVNHVRTLSMTRRFKGPLAYC